MTEPKRTLKMLKSHNTIWHPESTLVYKSQKEKVIIGRYVDNTLIPLDKVALRLCEKWNFTPDSSLVIVDEESENPDDEEDDSDCEEESEESEEGESEEENGEESDGEIESEHVKVSKEPEQHAIKKPVVTRQEPVVTKQEPVVTRQEPVVKQETIISSDLPQLIKKAHDIHNELEHVEKLVSDYANIFKTEISSLQEKLKEKTVENEKLKANYEMLNKKFNAIKSALL